MYNTLMDIDYSILITLYIFSLLSFFAVRALPMFAAKMNNILNNKHIAEKTIDNLEFLLPFLDGQTINIVGKISRQEQGQIVVTSYDDN